MPKVLPIFFKLSFINWFIETLKEYNNVNEIEYVEKRVGVGGYDQIWS